MIYDAGPADVRDVLEVVGTMVPAIGNRCYEGEERIVSR